MADLAHSPKGASSAERWMACPGSAVLLSQMNMPQTDEPEYRGLGIAAHEAAAKCLIEGMDTWEIVGQKFHGTFECDQEMADAVQMYLDYCRPLMADAKTVLIEQRIGADPATRPHPDFYGTADFAAYGQDILEVVDYKHGEGIRVDPDENPQLMYYGYGVLLERINRGAQVRSDRVVRLTIVQPRCYADERIRSWDTTAGELIHWAENVLIPAMQAAEVDQTFDVGKWCRFCPAKLVCPLLTALFGAAARANPKAIPNFKSDRLSLEYQQLDAIKFYTKALEEEIYRRNMLGNTVPGTKLVQKQAKRVFKAGADDIFRETFGAEALAPSELKTPSQMEKIGPAAKKLVNQWAYTPNNGLTIAALDDKRGAVKVDKTSDLYAEFIQTVGDDAPRD